MEAYIVIFMLLFAILAFGWFYLQRAKTRGPAADGEAVGAAAAPAPSTAAPTTPAATSVSFNPAPATAGFPAAAEA